MRINKYLASAGVCSRRAADEMIKDNRVYIGDKPALPGDDVALEDKVYVDGVPVSSKAIDEEKEILLFNKPKGLICSASDIDGTTVIDYVNYPKRLFYAGRLDKTSRGLMILTNDGELANELMRSRNAHEREYTVVLKKPIEDSDLAKLKKGIYLPELKVKTRPCKVKRIDETSFSIVLTQGLNRQIRRMCASVGANVKDLCRVRIADLHLGNLKEGAYRKITEKEKESLMALLGKE